MKDSQTDLKAPVHTNGFSKPRARRAASARHGARQRRFTPGSPDLVELGEFRIVHIVGELFDAPLVERLDQRLSNPVCSPPPPAPQRRSAGRVSLFMGLRIGGMDVGPVICCAP